MTNIESLRSSRKHPSVLKLQILRIRGQDPDILIFCHEGPEDVPVYEEWMKRIAGCPKYEPVPGAGKQQLIEYHRQLVDSADPLLERIYFFVDRDFDLPANEDSHLFELDCYSIENLVCNEEVLESLLRDEFRRSGGINERARIKTKFTDLLKNFESHCAPINFLLFAAQRTGARVVKKPEKVTEIVSVSVDSIECAYADPSDIVAVDVLPNNAELNALRAEFAALPEVLRQRGKYLLDMFRRWLRALVEDLRNPTPIFFDTQDDRLPGDPSCVSLRRLASSAPVPKKLQSYIEASVIG